MLDVVNNTRRARVAAGWTGRRPSTNVLIVVDVHAMIDSLGDVGAAPSDARPEANRVCGVPTVLATVLAVLLIPITAQA